MKAGLRQRRTFRLLRDAFVYPGRVINLSGCFFQNHRKQQRVSFLPYRLDIEPTARCNLRCEFCQLSNWNRQCPDLTSASFQQIVRQIPSLVSIKLQGIGEPLLNKEFFSLVHYAAKKRIQVITTTNGMLLDADRRASLLSCGLTWLRVSLDGATPETHNRIRSRADFERIIANLRSLIKERGQAREPVISAWMVGSKDNIGELPQLVELCAAIGLDGVMLQHDLIYWGKEDWRNKLKTRSLETDSEEVARLLQAAARQAEKKQIAFTVYQGNRYDRAKKEKCSWPWIAAYISADGYVLPCCVVSDPRVINFGNIITTPFAQIWNSQPYQSFRRALSNDDTLPEICRDCYS